jgi:hypothetical protein
MTMPDALTARAPPIGAPGGLGSALGKLAGSPGPRHEPLDVLRQQGLVGATHVPRPTRKTPHGPQAIHRDRADVAAPRRLRELHQPIRDDSLHGTAHGDGGVLARRHTRGGAEVEMKRATMDEAWGARTFGLSDPFGNTTFVMGPLPKG